MKRPLYYLLCAIACTSMVGATLPMTAIAEAIQSRETAEQQAQADATNSYTDKAEDGANTNATADTAGDSTATSTGTSAVNTESTDGTTAATGTTAPSLRTQATPTPAAISPTSQTTYAHSATASQNGVTFTVSWNDAPAGTTTTFHVTQTNGSSQAKARMDVPTYWDGGSQESVCDPSRPAWSGYCSLGTAGHDFTFDFTASGTYRIHFYFMDNDRYDPQNDKGIYYLRTTAEVTENDAARPSVTQIVNKAVDLCRQETDGSEYDMALWLHDWTLDQLEYDHGLNWCSAESGLTRHQGTCESYQRIYSKLLNAAGIANGRITGNGHTWNAVKIDGKWCQMDLTWDDTSDNWYGDLDQRHLYFGLTDELMAIAHSDHTANYQKNEYTYRSTDLSNNYFVRNGKADEWAEKYADRIQQHLNAREESFSIDADNQSFPPSISGIQNGIVAYAMNQREWETDNAKVELTSVSIVITQTGNKWSARYDFAPQYKTAIPFPELAGASWTLLSADDPSRAVDCWSASVEPGARAMAWSRNGGLNQALRFHDLGDGSVSIAFAHSGLALTADSAEAGSRVRQQAWSGAAEQRWEAVARGEGLVLRLAGTGKYAAFQGGSPADGSGLVLADGEEAASVLVAAKAPFPELAGASWTLLSADDPSRAVDCWSASVEPGARAMAWSRNGGLNQALRFHDLGDGSVSIAFAHSGLALTADSAEAGSRVRQQAWSGAAEQRWEAVARGEGLVLRLAGTGKYAAFQGGSPADGSGLVLADGEEAASVLVAAKVIG